MVRGKNKRGRNWNVLKNIFKIHRYRVRIRLFFFFFARFTGGIKGNEIKMTLTAQ